jgi:hypothetical protein
VEMNMNSLSLAAAINKGVMGVDTLEEIDKTFNFKFDECILIIGTYYDARYANADLVWCAISATNNTTGLSAELSWLPFCTVVTGQVLVMPLFTPYDLGCIGCEGGPTATTASDDDNGADDFYDDYGGTPYGGQDGCHDPKLIATFVYAPYGDSHMGIDTLIRLQMKMESDDLRRSVGKVAISEETDLYEHCPGCSVMSVIFIDDVVTGKCFYDMSYAIYVFV